MKGRKLIWVKVDDYLYDTEADTVRENPVSLIVFRPQGGNGPMGKYDVIEVTYNEAMITIPAHMAKAWGEEDCT